MRGVSCVFERFDEHNLFLERTTVENALLPLGCDIGEADPGSIGNRSHNFKHVCQFECPPNRCNPMKPSMDLSVEDLQAKSPNEGYLDHPSYG